MLRCCPRSRPGCCRCGRPQSLRPPEALAAGDVGGDVGVVEALAVRPGEVTVPVGNRSEHQLGITIGDQVVLEVVRQRSDRTIRVRHAAGIGRRRHAGCEVGLPQAARRHASRQTGVRRLGPCPSGVSGELDARDPTPGVNGRCDRRQRCTPPCRCCRWLRRPESRVDRINGKSRLVLLVLGEERVVAAHGHLGRATGRERGGDGQPLDDNCRECRECGCGKPACAHDAP